MIKKSNDIMTTAAIFVAAGSSTRMGEKNKLLLPYSNSTLVYHTFTQLQKSVINKIVIVTGFEANKIKMALHKKNTQFAHNEKHLSGLSSSIQTGIKALANKFDAYMIALSDMPYLKTADYNKLINAFRLSYKFQPLIIVPQIGECNGNPVIFSKEFIPEILNHKKPEGCKAIIQKNNKFVKFVSLNSLKAFNDIDLPKDYQKLINVRIRPNN